MLRAGGGQAIKSIHPTWSDSEQTAPKLGRS